MKNLIYFFILLFLAVSCNENSLIENSALDNLTVSNRSTVPICVTSWNTLLLDAPLFGPQCEGAPCIAKATAVCSTAVLLNSDVVLFQEVFEEVAIDALISCMTSSGYPFHSGVPDHPEVCWPLQFKPKNSGLITFSKFPIVKEIFTPFECGDCVGVDCLATKGFLHTQIKLEDGCFLDVVNTHLQAGIENGDVRMEQIETINNYISIVNGINPFVLGGDLNINVTDPLLGAIHPGLTSGFTSLGLAPGASASDGQLLDYILLDGDATATAYGVGTGGGPNPSDHLPVNTCFEVFCNGDGSGPTGNTNPLGCFPKCPPQHECINGRCVPQ